MKNLESLYSDYLTTGVCDAEAFLEIRSANNYLDGLNGKRLDLKSISGPIGHFLCLELKILRPSHFSELGFFLNSGGSVQRIGNPLEYLAGCDEQTSFEKVSSEVVWTREMCSATSQWVRGKLAAYEGERELEFNEDLAKLKEYFQEFSAEMEDRKKTIFFHNYFFEKEAKLKEEFAYMVEDLSEQGKNLHGRYKTIIDLKVLFWGVIS